jgi:DNA-directed RNA polymerase III subunit RPC1
LFQISAWKLYSGLKVLFPLCSARFIGNHGFSIGVDDVQPGEHLNRQKKKEIDGGYKKCHDLISLFAKGALALHPGCNAAQTLEHNITGVLNEIRSIAGNVSLHIVS